MALRFLFLLFLGCNFHPPATAQTPTVYLLPTLHRLHAENKAYSYDSLRAVIGRIRPQVIAVELRPEDVGADTTYLKANYPYEMWMMPYWFPSAAIQGIDWLGADIEGRPIPANYWRDSSKIKHMERQLDKDVALQRQLKDCDSAIDRRMALLKTGSLQQLVAGSYHTLTAAYYQCLSHRLNGTPYQYIPDFYEARNLALARRCAAIIMMHPGKTVVFLTGADHYGYIHQFLETRGIRLEPVP